MIELKTLGTAEVRRDDGTLIQSVTARAKPLGLLVYLVLSSGDGPRRRESVVSLLWPESDETRARNSLNQALHVLRSGIGAKAIHGGRDTVGIDLHRIRCDAIQFRQAIEDADWQRALELYGGELLPGLHVTGAPEFQRWLDAERQQTRRTAFRAARRLADEAGDDLRARIGALRQARRIRPDDDETVRELIEVCRQQGNVAAALQEFESYRAWLGENFDIDPPQATVALAQALRGEAARQERPGRPAAGGRVSRVRMGDVDVPPDATGQEPATPVPEPNTGPARRRGLWLSLAAAVVLIVSLDATWTIIRERAGEDPGKSLLSESEFPELDHDALAVPPFSVVSADEALADLADDLPLALYTKVTGEFGPRVLDPRLVRTEWANIGSRSDLPPLQAEALNAARGLAAGQLIQGTVIGTEQSTELHASLIDVETGRTITQSVQRGTYDEWPSMVDDMVVELLASHYEDLADRIPKLGDHPPEAVQAYLAGVRVWNRQQGDYEDIDYYREAIERDSTFVLAALAGYLAGEKDEYLARYAWERRDRLSPRDRAVLVAGAGKLFGEIESVRDEIEAWERVLELDPENFQAHYELGEAYFGFGARIDQADYLSRAKRHLRRALRHDPDYLWLHWKLSAIALVEGDSAAIAEHLAVFDRVAPPESCGRQRRHGQARAFGFRLEPMTDEYGGLGPHCETRAILEGAVMTGRSMDLARAATRAFEDAGGPTFIPLTMAQWWGWYDTWLAFLGRPRWKTFATPPGFSDALEPNLAVIRAAVNVGVPDSLALPSVRQLRRIAAQQASSVEDREEIATALCWLAQWDLFRGDTTGVAETILHMREDTPLPGFFSACAGLLEAWRLRVVGLPGTEALLAYDSLVRQGPLRHGPTGSLEPTQNLLLTRWLREDGDYERALRAARRGRSSTPFQAVVLNDGFDMAYLREEAPLHALVGDTTAAIEAYERYLTFREEASGPWALQLDSVRAEYLALTGGPPDG